MRSIPPGQSTFPCSTRNHAAAPGKREAYQGANAKPMLGLSATKRRLSVWRRRPPPEDRCDKPDDQRMRRRDGPKAEGGAPRNPELRPKADDIAALQVASTDAVEPVIPELDEP